MGPDPEQWGGRSTWPYAGLCPCPPPVILDGHFASVSDKDEPNLLFVIDRHKTWWYLATYGGILMCAETASLKINYCRCGYPCNI